MNQPTLSRLGAACGAVFAIVLIVATGDGNSVLRSAGGRRHRGPHPGPPVPRLSVHRAAHRRRSGRLAGPARRSPPGSPASRSSSAAVPRSWPCTGLISPPAPSSTPRSTRSPGRDRAEPVPARRVLRGRRHRRLPDPGAPALAGHRRRGHRRRARVNGGFLGTDSVPALLLFALWTLLTSVHLLRRTWRKPLPAAQAQAQAASRRRRLSTRGPGSTRGQPCCSFSRAAALSSARCDRPGGRLPRKVAPLHPPVGHGRLPG